MNGSGKSRWLPCLVLCLGLAGTNSANGYDDEVPKTMHLGPVLTLLERPSVLRELRVREDQLEYLQCIEIDLRQEIRLAMPPSQLKPPDPATISDFQLPPPSRELQRVIVRADQLAAELVGLVLDPDQQQRLDQLLLQLEGPRALMRDEFRRQIRVEDSQVPALRTLVTQWVRHAVKEEPEATTIRQRIMQSLSAVQRRAWRARCGEPFAGIQQ